MRKIILIIALCTSLTACTQSQVQSAGTIANQSADILYANAELLGQLLVAQGKISQAAYDKWDAKAGAVVSAVKIGTMTAQDLQAVIAEMKASQPLPPPVS